MKYKFIYYVGWPKGLHSGETFYNYLENCQLTKKEAFKLYKEQTKDNELSIVLRMPSGGYKGIFSRLQNELSLECFNNMHKRLIEYYKENLKWVDIHL